MPLDPNNLQGEKLSAFPEATALSDIWLAAFKKNTANYYVKATSFALNENTYTKNEVISLLQTLANNLTTQIKAIRQTYKLVYMPQQQSNTIQDNTLKGSDLLLVIIDNMVNEAITLDNTTGTLDFSPINGVYPGNYIIVLINKSGQ